jgi:glutathione S-transferase
MTVTSDITLYTDNTPNGAKAPIILEELGLPYKLEHLSIQSGRQKEECVPEACLIEWVTDRG